MKRTLTEPNRAQMGSGDPDEQLLARYAALLPDPRPDDLVVERVWRKMHPPPVERRSASGWRWAVASVMALLLIEAGVGLWLMRPKPGAEILMAEGGVFAGVRGSSWVPVRRGDPLRAGSLLRSDESGRSVLRLPGVAALVVGTAADLSLEQLGRATAILLDRGTVTARVTKRPKDAPFSVLAGDFTVTVVGTLFSVSNSDGRVAVTVNEGAVEVAGREGRWRVGAGSTWNSDVPVEQRAGNVPAARVALLLAAVKTPPSPEVPQLFRELVRSETTTLTATPTSTVTENPAPTATPTPTATSTPTPTSTSTHHPRHPSAPLVARLDSPSREPPVVPPLVLEPAPTPIPAPTPTTAPITTPVPAATSVAPPPTSVPDYYSEALDLSRHGEHEKAAALLEKAIGIPGGPHDLELYQLAVLRQRHLNDVRGALDALLEYRKVYPQGTLRQEVDLSIVEVDRALGRNEAALAESTRFLAQHPQSERVDDVRVLRGDLLRQHGDCAAAVVEYRAVAGGSALDDALYDIAYCRREMGDSAGATAGLRDYLARFPSGRHSNAAREALGQ